MFQGARGKPGEDGTPGEDGDMGPPGVDVSTTSKIHKNVLRGGMSVSNVSKSDSPYTSPLYVRALSCSSN